MTNYNKISSNKKFEDKNDNEVVESKNKNSIEKPDCKTESEVVIPTDKEQKAVVTPSLLNCRKTPDINADVIIVFEKDTVVAVSPDNVEGKDWTKVSAQGRIGFCMTKYLKLV